MNNQWNTATVDPERIGMALGQMLGEYVQKAQTSGAPVGPYVHGPGGLFGVRGLKQGIISVFTNITGSLGELLPIGATGAAMMENDLYPLFPYITDFNRADQQEKNAICDTPVQAGGMQTALQTIQFGRKEFKTRQVEINHIGQEINRGEFMDINLLNSPLVNQMGGLLQNTFGLQNVQAALAGREMLMRIIEVGVAYQRWFCPTIYTGNPANNSSGGGYKEFPGLDLQISTTKVDALSGAAVPGLRSDMRDFAYKDVVATTGQNGIVFVFQSLFHALRNRARQNNLNEVEWAIVMRSDLFYMMTAIWPYLYNTDMAAFAAAANGANNMTNDFITGQRDAMRTGLYLPIDGIRYRVILDDTIAEKTHNNVASIAIGGYASDIYIIPMSARNGTIRTLYWEYYDYGKGSLPAASDLRASNFFWSDNGVFLWSLKAPDNWCVEMISKCEPRLILLTPQLAGKITNCQYIPLEHVNDPLPSSPYHVTGGVSTGYPLPSPYSPWNLGGPGMGA